MSLEVQFFAHTIVSPIEPYTNFFSLTARQKTAIEKSFYFCGMCQGLIHWLRENTSGGLMSFSNNCIFFFKTSLEVQFFADITMCPIEPHTQFFSSITSQKNAIENCFYFCGVFVFAKGLCTDSAQTRLGFSCLKKKFVKTLLKLYEKFQIFYSSWVKAFSHW